MWIFIQKKSDPFNLFIFKKIKLTGQTAPFRQEEKTKNL